MKTSDFIDHPEVQHIIEDLQTIRAKNPEKFIFSDVIDSEGRQYVDLVQEGGGVLGVALIGYTYVLEQMGLRYVSLAGTSAGAINTILLAGLGKPHEMKSSRIIDLLANKSFMDFVYGNWIARKLIQAYNRGSGWLKLGLWALPALMEVRRNMGLNPGDHFHEWIKGILADHQIKTAEELEDNMNAFPAGIRFREGIEPPYWPIRSSLAIIAADLTTETKVVFPVMAGLYYREPDQVNPADFVRASMSIPIFFEPHRITNLPPDQAYQWRTQALYRGPVPEEVVMVDGGTLSNFAIDVFHRTDIIPTRPTFGVKLGLERTQPNKIGKCTQVAGGCFNTACQIRDLEFILNHPDYTHLVAMVDVGKHDWMNFGLTDEAKIDLFVRGARTAANFLRSFDWAKYKKIRAGLLSDKVIDIWAFSKERRAVSAH